MESLKTIEDIYEKYDLKKDLKHLYNDINFDKKGIDYKKYMKIYRTEIKNYAIKDFYTSNHWYILCYLISKSIDSVYVETTINSISEDLNYKPHELSKHLEEMVKKKLIFVKCSKFTNGSILKIAINYSIMEHENSEDFVYLPNDFIRAIIPTVSLSQWSIFTILCVFYNNLLKNNGKVKQISCSSITQEAIADLIGFKDLRSIRNNIKRLEQREEPLIISNNNYYEEGNFVFYKGADNKNKIKQINKVYNILLFESIEYNYYYNYLINKDNEITCLDEKTFILMFYKNIMEKYEECLQTYSFEYYNKLKNNKIKAKDNDDKYLELKNSGMFILEKDLEKFLIENLNLIEDGLKFVDNQYNIEFGRIDILAKDKKNNTCIIELKINDDDKRLITQCSTYPLGFENEDKIRMITIAPNYKESIFKAISKIPNIEIYKYNIINNDLNTIKISKIN